MHIMIGPRFGFFLVFLRCGSSSRYNNETGDAVSNQLLEFRQRHPLPLEVWTKASGDFIDLRDTVSLNNIDIFDNKQHFSLLSHTNRERIPERVVHAKGYGAFGYFEVTNDISKYTKASVFNGIGKRTPVVGRFSTGSQNLGGNDLAREFKGLALKFYTKEGNLDLLNLNIPILYKDPLDFASLIRVNRRNPRTGTPDNTMVWDFITLRPDSLFIVLWLQSDLGIPDGYRKMNAFPIHTYEVYNKHGERYYVKFNFRTEIGLYNLTTAQAQAISSRDPDYYVRDLYNAIASKDYPSWRLEMDILTRDNLLKVDYNPFNINRLWKRGTYKTVTVGRLVFNRRVDNNFKDIETAAFNPDNLVPGILGPPDAVFRARRIFYRDTQNYRLGVNHLNAKVNAPLNYEKYERDGRLPVLDNMADTPNYYPNTFNGPIPYVDEDRPTERLHILQSNAMDLEPMAEFYNEIVESDEHRQRIADNFAARLRGVPEELENRAIKLLSMIDLDLGERVRKAVKKLKIVERLVPLKERDNRVAQCIADSVNPDLEYPEPRS